MYQPIWTFLQPYNFYFDIFQKYSQRILYLYKVITKQSRIKQHKPRRLLRFNKFLQCMYIAFIQRLLDLATIVEVFYKRILVSNISNYVIKYLKQQFQVMNSKFQRNFTRFVLQVINLLSQHITLSEITIFRMLSMFERLI